MRYEFQLSYMDAVTKSLKIVKRDAEHMDNEVLPLKIQVKKLTTFYMKVDPDKLLESMQTTESDESILKSDVRFMMKMYDYKIFPSKLQKSFFDKKRYYQLMKKYKFPFGHMNETWNIQDFVFLPSMAFPKQFYKFQVEHAHLKERLPKLSYKYKHFKTEYAVTSIMSLLPAGQNYGGFVKVNLHVWLMDSVNDDNSPVAVAYLRSLYNTKMFSNDERLKWFNELGIKEEDCALWSKIFDKQFPGYKDIHKLFGQIS